MWWEKMTLSKDVVKNMTLCRDVVKIVVIQDDALYRWCHNRSV